VHCTDFVLALYSIQTGQNQEHVPEQLLDIVSGLGTGLNEHHIKFFGLNRRIYLLAILYFALPNDAGCVRYVNRYENVVDSDPDTFWARRIQSRIRLLYLFKKKQYSSDNLFLKIVTVVVDYVPILTVLYQIPIP
jgi:hypothetical protein